MFSRNISDIKLCLIVYTMVKPSKMICRPVYGLLFIVLHVTISTAYDHEQSKPIQHASENKRSLAGGLTIGQSNLERGGSSYGNQAVKREVYPTPTSISAETGCHYAMDLVLVLDCSHSITADGWLNIKQAAKSVINGLDVSPQGTHISIIVYSSDVENFFTFDVNPNKQTLTELIDGLYFFGEWSRLDIALNAVLHHVFLPLSGARDNVPKVVAVFTDGNTDGATTNPDESPDWLRIIAKPLDALRAQNVTLYAVASSTNNNNYQELNLIGADRANVFNITDINKLAESLVRVSKQVCPDKPSVCTSMPSSCLTSSTCYPQLSTCIPVIPPTSCTRITTTCQNTESTTSINDKNNDATAIKPQIKTLTITLTKYIVVTEAVGVTEQASIQQTASTTATTTTELAETPATILASSLESSMISSATESSSAITSGEIPDGTIFVSMETTASETSNIDEASSILATSPMTTATSPMTTAPSSIMTSDAASYPESSASPQASSNRDQLIRSTNRFAAEQKKRSWFDTGYLPDFVKKWMAVEP